MEIERLADGLGWPEGPTVLPDGRVVFVESYRSQLSVWSTDGVTRYAYTAGAPNSSVLGCRWRHLRVPERRHRGSVARGRDDERVDPARSITRAPPPRSSSTEIEGIALNGPNDLVFGAERLALLHRPGHVSAGGPGAELHLRHRPIGHGPRRDRVRDAGLPQWHRRRGRRLDRVGRVVHGTCRAAATRWHVARTWVACPARIPILDGMKVGADGRLYVTDITGAGIHVLQRDGTEDRFIPCGNATTNCAFDGTSLYMTDAGVPADSADASYGGALWRIAIGVEGQPLHPGAIARPGR